MTAKEVEHWLIENDFDYKKDEQFPYWQHRFSFAGVSDDYVQTTPNEALEFVRGMMPQAASCD